MANNNFANLEYAHWLEQALQELFEFPVKGICIFATTKDGAVYSNYHNVPMSDKLILSGFIQQDAMIDTLRDNGLIKTADEEYAED